MSPRYKKPRFCKCPFRKLRGQVFKPTGVPLTELELITVYRDELEAMCLCDIDNLTQEETGAKMGISRGTVQRLLEEGRRKVLTSIIKKQALVFQKEGNVSAKKKKCCKI
ncbi:MAG: DUF134 domain-containing protein [Nitrospiraceae bacterium]|nr:DUF134 domain-containing protein [Nitrospiraceae bacterium]